MNDDDCDYCGATYDADEGSYLRAVGFTQLTGDGPRLPLVKTWCGNCEPGDEPNDEANAAVRASLAEQGRRLASRREDLIAAGVAPDGLPVPIHPDEEEPA